MTDATPATPAAPAKAKSEFVQLRNGLENWIESLWKSGTVQTVASDLESGAAQVAKTALVAGGTAALAAHAAGGDQGTIEKAAESAALKSAETVGVTVGTDVLQAGVKAISQSIHGDDPGTPPATGSGT